MAIQLCCTALLEQGLTTDKNAGLAASMAMVVAHKRSTHVDEETLHFFEGRVKEEVRACTDAAREVPLYHGALFLWFDKRHERARGIADKILKQNKSSILGNTVRGWIDLTCGLENYEKKSIKYFEEAIANGGENPKSSVSAMFGKMQFLLSQNKAAAALELCDTVLGLFPDFHPALVEKGKIHAALSQWDAAIDVAQRTLDIDTHCVASRQLIVLHKLCRCGNYEDAAGVIGDLIVALDAAEPKNHRAFFAAAQVHDG